MDVNRRPAGGLVFGTLRGHVGRIRVLTWTILIFAAFTGLCAFARVSSHVSLGWQGGVLLAALVTPMLLPVIGWRDMFVVGLLPALVAFPMPDAAVAPVVEEDGLTNRYCAPIFIEKCGLKM